MKALLHSDSSELEAEPSVSGSLRRIGWVFFIIQTAVCKLLDIALKFPPAHCGNLNLALTTAGVAVCC